ncbi:MAG TPA: arsenite methyltransferase [Acidimicrobiia bacterium]|nr:arsenite methyltransferase [Acidimicrobiia bacterium]
MTTQEHDEILTAVRDFYADAARAVDATSCCDAPGATSGLIGGTLYGEDDAGALPDAAVAASLGCGNPTILAELVPGDVVLDLGSGGGIDVLLSARRVGPTGKAYGLDMTPEMNDLARANQAEAGVTNAEFLHGTIEHVPLPDASVDVIISNCVVNLSPDKDAVLREAFRVLAPGGRFAISDIVLRRPLPGPVQRLVGLWTGCIAGALLETDYDAKLAAAGFVDMGIEPTRVFDRDDLVRMAADMFTTVDTPEEFDVDRTAADLDGAVMSAFVRARKPA